LLPFIFQIFVILRSGPLGRVSKDHCGCATASQKRQSGIFAADQRLLLFPTPTFKLTLRSDGVFQTIKIVVEN
jgi:hypothetical protein